ncbi:MAG: replicative DNA helicase, partial [Gammaproteobacteria bacterium]|nr:replicative DNA helicase [Gammaproteobacteria bacterium]
MQELVYSRTRGLDSETAQLKTPPHSIEAEQSVLGGLMLDNRSWDYIADLVREEDFYRRDHRLIFRAISSLAERSQPYDVVTLSEWLDSHRELDNAGGLAYLATLAKNTPSAANIKAYATIVRERSILRQLIEIGAGITTQAYQPEGRNSAELLEQAERLIFGIAEGSARGRRSYSAIKDLLVRVVDRIDTLSQQGGALTGVSSGFSDIDEMTAGLQNTDLIIVAGRPSMGKAQPLDARIKT